MIVTDDETIADEARTYRDQGKGSFLANFHTRLGANWRMSEPHAAIVLSQLGRLDEFIAARQAPREALRRGRRRARAAPAHDPGRTRTATTTSTSRSCPTASTATTLKQTMRERFDIGLSGEVYDTPLHQQPVFAPSRRPAAARRGVAVCPAHLSAAVSVVDRSRRRSTSSSRSPPCSPTRPLPSAITANRIGGPGVGGDSRSRDWERIDAIPTEQRAEDRVVAELGPPGARSEVCRFGERGPRTPALSKGASEVSKSQATLADVGGPRQKTPLDEQTSR